VGLGVGLAHVRAMRKLPDHFHVRAVCDPDPARSAPVADRVGADVQSLEAILDRDDIGVVALCTPPHLHREQIEQVLRAGKTCVCEKPLVGSVAEVDELAAIEAASPGALMPVFNYRYGHGLQKLKLLVDSGVTGRLYAASMLLAWRRRADYYAVEWRGRKATELGGVLLSHAVHGLDAFLYLFGEPAVVTARIATLVNEVETEDTAAAILEMPDGALVTVTATLGSAEEVSQHRFAFANLSAASGVAPYTFTDEPWTFTPDTPDSAAQVEAVLATYVPQADGWTGQYERFAAALDAGNPPPVTVDDARRVIALVERMYACSGVGDA
jgi:predicted dehydrogenase